MQPHTRKQPQKRTESEIQQLRLGTARSIKQCAHRENVLDAVTNVYAPRLGNPIPFMRFVLDL